MSTPFELPAVTPAMDGRGDVRRGWVLAAAIAAAAGLWWDLSPVLTVLWQTWMHDPLRSIGILVPPASLALTLRAWKGLEWRPQDGSWWGLLVLSLAAVARWVFDRFNLGLPGLTGTAHVVPTGVLVWAYVSGAVLLFAGTRAYRRAGFSIGLLLLINPAPAFLVHSFDYPLQALGADTARNMAGWLGLHLQGQQLHLMFAPDLGMFIAPGCNGLHGAVTLGLLALVIGHLGGQRPWVHALFVVGAVLLGYLLNLLRLCVLVIAYALALHWPFLARHMEAADYVIGVCLFCGAIALLLPAIRPAKARV